MTDKPEQGRTPRTNVESWAHPTDGAEVVDASFCRTLERELAAAQAEANEAKSGEEALMICIQTACEVLGEQVQPAFLPDLIKSKLAAAQAECNEQARLNGAGGSREAALMAKLAMWRQIASERNDEIQRLKADIAAIEARTIERRDWRHINNILTDFFARKFHYLENIDRIQSLKTAAEVNESVDGGIKRYMVDPIFKAKVDILVAGVTEIIRALTQSAAEKKEPT